MTARALITGIGGQDGTYLAERLVGEGMEVHALVLSADGHPAHCPDDHAAASSWMALAKSPTSVKLRYTDAKRT